VTGESEDTASLRVVTAGRMEGLDAVAPVTLNRPEQRNALASDDLREGIAALGERRKPRFKGA
jgi:enoyl-CoA hydratase/carnithine racemase